MRRSAIKKEGMKLFLKGLVLLTSKSPYIIPVKQPKVRDPKMWMSAIIIVF